MKIKELNLISFGKFQNKTISLQDGINIIYGENEAGKTTIHNFINGMFYGFLRPNVKRTFYLEEHAKYKPWNKEDYSGIISFSQDKEDYRIERRFTKGEEETLVLIEDTGEDISQNIDNGDRGRVLQPGFQFFGFNDTIYNNTISISQLGNKPEDELANQVRDKLINISTSLDDRLSVDGALEDLDRKLKEIGSSRAPTSIYSRTERKLRELKEEKKSIERLREEYEELLSKDIELEEKLNLENKNLDLLKEDLDRAILLDKYKLYREVKSLENEIASLKNQSNKLRKYKDLSRKDYEEGRDLYNEIKNLNKQEKDLAKSLEETNRRLEELKSQENIDRRRNKDITEDYMAFQEYEREIGEREDKNKTNDLDILKIDYNNHNNSKNIFTGIFLSSIIISLVSIIIFIFNHVFISLGINIISIPGAFLSFIQLRRIKIKLDTIKEKQEKTRKDKGENLREIEGLRERQKAILNKYRLNSKIELKEVYDSNYILKLQVDSRKENYRDNKERKDEYLKGIKDVKEEKEGKILVLKNLLKRNYAESLEEFKDYLGRQDSYQTIVREIENKKVILRKTLNNLDLDKLEEEVSKDIDKINSLEEGLVPEEIQKEVDRQKSKISKIKIDKISIEERQKGLNQDISRLVNLNEEIKRKESLINSFNRKKDSIKMAKKSIENISKNLHRDFAPSINRKVGGIIKKITNNKYKEIKIDDNLQVGIINPITKEIIDINSLSGGTIDQLYFALRFGLIDSINNKNLPLLLDDCFIQYDEGRLKNILNFLVEEGKERQIILFTCHNREKELLRKMNIGFNLVSLS